MPLCLLRAPHKFVIESNYLTVFSALRQLKIILYRNNDFTNRRQSRNNTICSPFVVNIVNKQQLDITVSAVENDDGSIEDFLDVTSNAYVNRNAHFLTCHVSFITLFLGSRLLCLARVLNCKVYHDENLVTLDSPAGCSRQHSDCLKYP